MPSGWSVAWRGVAWRGVAWRGVAWRGVVWRGVVWRGVAWCGVAWRGVVTADLPARAATGRCTAALERDTRVPRIFCD
jgi:hypothetical protein